MRAWLRHRHWRGWRRRPVMGTAVMSLLVVTGVAEAPGAGEAIRSVGGTIAVAATGREGPPRAGDFYSWDDVSARAGAPARITEMAGAGLGSAGSGVVAYRDPSQEMPWRRTPMVGMTPLPPMRVESESPAEPVFAPLVRTPEFRELPSLRATPAQVSYAIGLGTPAQRSARLTDLVKNPPVDATVPDELLPPGVGSSVPPTPGVAVPEPTGTIAVFALLTFSLSRRPR